jgi:esterase/lipase superfamily enzyme
MTDEIPPGMTDHDPESIHRAAGLLRYYHRGNERAWLSTIQGDRREYGHYAVICGLAAITDGLIQLIADWSGAEFDTILTTHEIRTVKAAEARTEGNPQ